MKNVKATFGIENKSTNGPKFTVSRLKQESLHILDEDTKTLEETLSNFDLKTLL